MATELNKKKYSIKTDFNMLALLIIPISVAVNFVGGQLALLLKLPIFMDTIGTIFASMLCGPWVGALAGVLTNVCSSITAPQTLPFALVSIGVGLTTGFLARANWFSTWWKWLISMLLITIVSVLISTPLVVIVFGGATGSGASLVTATLLAAGADIWQSVIGGDSVLTFVDRVIAYVVSWSIIKVIPDRTLVKFGCGMNYIKPKKAEEKNK